jgi:uncharacterized membrane protein (DUF485 family)
MNEAIRWVQSKFNGNLNTVMYIVIAANLLFWVAAGFIIGFWSVGLRGGDARAIIDFHSRISWLDWKESVIARYWIYFVVAAVIGIAFPLLARTLFKEKVELSLVIGVALQVLIAFGGLSVLFTVFDNVNFDAVNWGNLLIFYLGGLWLPMLLFVLGTCLFIFCKDVSE